MGVNSLGFGSQKHEGILNGAFCQPGSAAHISVILSFQFVSNEYSESGNSSRRESKPFDFSSHFLSYSGRVPSDLSFLHLSLSFITSSTASLSHLVEDLRDVSVWFNCFLLTVSRRAQLIVGTKTSTDLVRFMPFHPIETRRPSTRLFPLFALTGTLLFLSAPGFGQDLDLRPGTRAEYDAAQKQAVMKLRQTEGLLTPETLTDYTREARSYRDLVYRGTNGRVAKELEILRIGLAYKIFSLSDRAIQDDPRLIENVFKSLDRDISRAGGGLTNADDKKRFRLLLFREAFPMIEKLMENNFISRSLGLETLMLMEVVPARGNTRMEMFEETHKVIIRVLEDPTQPDAVKLRAANSAKRYLEKADAIPQIENDIAQALAKEVKRQFVGVPYQNSLLLALENVHAPRQLVSPRQPVAIKVAVELMQDKSQPIRTRCRAARLTGRAGYDAQVDYEPIAWLVADVALETSLLYAQSNDKKNSDWMHCGWYLYTAFMAENRAERQAKYGMLNRASDSAVVKGAYQALIPAVRVLLSGKGNLNAAVGTLNKWNQGNQPADLQYDPSCPPIAKGP